MEDYPWWYNSREYKCVNEHCGSYQVYAYCENRVYTYFLVGSKMRCHFKIIAHDQFSPFVHPNYHICTDDNQVYLAFDVKDPQHALDRFKCLPCRHSNMDDHKQA